MIQATKPLSSKEEKELVKKAKAGDKAAETRLLTSVIRLIRRSASKWRRHTCIDQEDLVQDGLMAASYALKKYNPERNTKFRTYAERWWNMAIGKSARAQLAQGRGGIASIVCDSVKFAKAFDDIPEDVGDKATVLADKLGVSRGVAFGFISLQKPINSLDVQKFDNGDTWLDRFESKTGSPEDILVQKELAETVLTQVNRLPMQHRRVFVLRHLHRRQMTLKEVGATMGVCRERARQIEKEAAQTLARRLASLEEGNT